jgi:type I restriction enzyme S subunit
MKITAKQEQARPTLLPKLRFPEFREAKWVQKKLEEVAPLQRGFDLPSDLIRPGDIPIVYSNGIQQYHEVGMATAPGLVTGRSGTIGKLHFIEHGEYWPHNTSLWVTDFKGNAPRFVYYLYGSIGMSRFSSGSGVPTLNRNDVHAFNALIPNSSAEQQKIAECLSSVDELIAAQARKVDALKTHKKGLMQQLFPREGESQPRLRFPEFQNAGEWVVKKLGEFADVAASGDLDSELFSPIKTNICCYPVYSNAVEQEGLYGYYSLPKYPANCVTITARGTLGVAFLRHANFMGIGRLLVLNFNQGIDSRFMKDCWNHLAKIPQEVTSIPQLTAVTARMTIFPIPSLEEQQRIATCLSSIDTLITAETQKLEALKTHKKGLMQQLFPSPGETLP